MRRRRSFRKRSRMSSKKSRARFRSGAKVKGKNMRVRPARGGWRL